MPNPLFRLRPNTSTTPPQRVTPVPERAVGEVFAYRGTEQHGVAPTTHFHDVPPIDETVDVHVEEQPPEQAPVPVRIVYEHSNERRDWRAVNVPVAGGAVGATPSTLIVGRNRSRTALRVKNTHATDIVYIGSSESVNAATGYPLAAGESITLDSARDGDVWGVPIGVNTVPVAIIMQYTTED
jgi:hypothetical protein